MWYELPALFLPGGFDAPSASQEQTEEPEAFSYFWSFSAQTLYTPEKGLY
jgi:hypothetical protein